MPASAFRIERWEGGCQFVADRLQCRSGSLRSHIHRKPHHHMQPLLEPSSLDRKLTLLQSNGNPQLSFVRGELKAMWHHADDRVGRSIQVDDAAEHIRIDTEGTAPQTVAKKCGPWGSILIFCCGESSS